MLGQTRYEHIVLDETQVPIIAGTSTKVVEIVLDHLAYGWSAEELHFLLNQIIFLPLWDRGS